MDFTAVEEAKFQDCTNKYCPRSGKPVSKDSLCSYKGKVFGFCNSHCRDDFCQTKNKSDSGYFEAILNGETEGYSLWGSRWVNSAKNFIFGE